MVYTATKPEAQFAPTTYAEPSSRLALGVNLPVAPEAQVTAIAASPTRKRARLELNLLAPSGRKRFVRALPWMLSIGVLSANVLFNAPMFVIGAGAASLTYRIMQEVIKRNHFLQRCLKTMADALGLTRIDRKWLNGMTAGIGGGLLMTLSSPAHALFFKEAETYMKTIFGAGSDASAANIIGLIFGSLRIIFVLYIAIALVRVIQAFRQDEDWVTAARIPMMVILCVVLGDVLSTVIVK